MLPEVTPPHGDATVEDLGSDVHWEGGPHYLTTFLFPEVSTPHGDATVEDHGSDVHWEGGPPPEVDDEQTEGDHTEDQQPVVEKEELTEDTG